MLVLAGACGDPALLEEVAVDRQAASIESESEIEPGLPPAGYMEQLAATTSSMSTTAMSPVVTESGFISLSVDAIGTNNPSGVVQVEKPAGATVRRAYLAAASTGFTGYQIPNGSIRIDNQAVSWNLSMPNRISSWNHWADVTALVQDKINQAPAGRVGFTVTESLTTRIEGEILAVIFDDPNTTTVNTVILLFGAQSTTGDTFHITMSDPINKSDPNLRLDLSLGISYGFQSGSTQEGQYSIVNVNGQRLSTQAGGQDDGAAQNGALITAGGLDDTNGNPPPTARGPGPRSDDELYDLLPFVNDGSTQITVTSQNPSNDDNIFFAALDVKSAAAILGEGIVLGPSLATGPTGTSHTVTATLQNDLGDPLPNRTVSFQVATGPNAGLTGQAVSNAQGRATFTYQGNGGVGRDELRASFVKSNGETGQSNPAYMDWTSSNQPPQALCRNLVLDAGATCGVSGSIDNGSTDPDGNLVGCTQSPAGPFGLGLTTVTLTCTDSEGLSSSCTGTVLVEDHSAPALSCPSNQVAECTGGGGATVDTGLATASDNCGAASVSSPAPAAYPLGTTSVVHSATDSSGNTSTCANTVTVVDTIAPSFTSVPAPVVVEYAAVGTPAAVGMATAADSCGAGVTVASDAPPLFPYGTTVVTFTATDAAGNQAQATTTVLVRDTTPPALSTPTILYAEATSSAGANVTFPVSAVDLRDGNVPVICTPPSGSAFPFGPTAVSCMASDSAGNVATATFTVIVQDTTPPEWITFPENITIEAWCVQGGWPYWDHPTAEDLVDGPVPVSCDAMPWTEFPLGTTAVTCTASDSSGNTATRSFTVSIIWGFGGFLPPLASDGSAQFQAGQAVPVSFELAGDSTWVVDVDARLYVAPVVNGVVGAESPAQPASSANTGNQFVYTWGYGTYDYGMATGHLTPGTYRLRADLGDGVERTVQITLNP